MFNDNLLDKAVHADPNYRPLIPPSLHSRFTRAWSDNDYGYKWAARMLELLRFTQLLIEMGLRRKASAKSRWRVIVLIEVLKYVFRLQTVLFLLNHVATQSIP